MKSPLLSLDRKIAYFVPGSVSERKKTSHEIRNGSATDGESVRCSTLRPISCAYRSPGYLPSPTRNTRYKPAAYVCEHNGSAVYAARRSRGKNIRKEEEEEEEEEVEEDSRG